MKKKDFIFIFFLVLFVLIFSIFPTTIDYYKSFNQSHGMFTSFIKFSLLATLGESLGLRVSKGFYNQKGFGLLPRAIVWGFLGLTIKISFVIFYTGVPHLLDYLFHGNFTEVMSQSAFSYKKLLGAFSISLLLNSIYAPVMMTFHKITDTHILNNGGRLKSLIQPIPFSSIFSTLDWNTQWNFIFKRTIPFFWIPAHTITFMLPTDYQVLFAAVLGIALGLILAFANLKSKKK